MNSELDAIKLEILDGSRGALHERIMQLNANPKRPLGKFHPWAWWLEIVQGCNLTCWHCPTRLMPRDYRHYMSKEDWVSLLHITKEVTPYNRYTLGNAGEPTLHPELLEFMSLAKEITPHTQIQLTTNGTKIIDGTYTYRDLFEAGVHTVYIDMYAPLERHIELAKASGYPYYELDKRPKDVPQVWTYHNDPDFKLIALVNPPTFWSAARLGQGRLHTFINQLDWEATKKYNLVPVTNPPNRRCDLPSKMVSTHSDGTYSFCCNDFLQANKAELGHISDGVQGFFKFWLGKYMQETRRKLHNKDRIGHEFCSQCSFVSLRADIPWWEPELLDQYWTGESWEDCDES
ncbi:MAG: radical SAM/SPASM domain-containing protein [Deltaproteobacteria bacterium]|nr:radical SAM/SPASM domain-containing protein [Deltaproteobacteria bacterium]